VSCKILDARAFLHAVRQRTFPLRPRCVCLAGNVWGGGGGAGVEMEALTAASTAALTIFDMCKAVSRLMEITDVRLERKTGGKSGTFDRSKGV